MSCVKNVLNFFLVFRENLHQHHLLVIRILVTNYTVTNKLSPEQPQTSTQKVDSVTFLMIIITAMIWFIK